MSAKPRCSFCNDDADQVDMMIRSDLAEPPPAIICENCIRLCVEVVAGHRARGQFVEMYGMSKRQRDKRADPPSGEAGRPACAS